jgi:hypothetical protein
VSVTDRRRPGALALKRDDRLGHPGTGVEHRHQVRHVLAPAAGRRPRGEQGVVRGVERGRARAPGLGGAVGADRAQVVGERVIGVGDRALFGGPGRQQPARHEEQHRPGDAGGEAQCDVPPGP